MAKLSAHDNEIARYEGFRILTDGTRYRTQYSVRSDGVVLRKHADEGWKRCSLRWVTQDDLMALEDLLRKASYLKVAKS